MFKAIKRMLTIRSAVIATGTVLLGTLGVKGLKMLPVVGDAVKKIED